MHRAVLPLSLLALVGCIPDFTDDLDKGEVEDDDAGDSGIDGEDPGGDAGGSGGAGPDWIGTHDATFRVETPFEDVLCEGTFTLTVSEDGAMSGETVCALLAGPGAGETVDLVVDAQGADPEADETEVGGTVLLELPGPGGQAEPAEAWGDAAPDGIAIYFETAGGPQGEGGLLGEITTR